MRQFICSVLAVAAAVGMYFGLKDILGKETVSWLCIVGAAPIAAAGFFKSVPKEVADFLEQDRKRQQAQDKQDARHLSKSEFETVLSGSNCVKRPVEDAVLRNLRLENLRGAIAKLDMQGQNLLSLRYSGELTMEEIGQIYGISRMAVSKRLKKLHKKLGSSVS